MAFSFMDGDGVNNLPSFLKIIFSFDILCDKSDFFFNASSGAGWVIRQAASFPCIAIPQSFLFLLETKQMENNDWSPSAVQKFHIEQLTLFYKTRPNEWIILLPVNSNIQLSFLWTKQEHKGASISLWEGGWLGCQARCAQAFMCVLVCASVCVPHS